MLYIAGMNPDLLLALACLVLTIAMIAAPQFIVLWAVLAALAAIIAFGVARMRP